VVRRGRLLEYTTIVWNLAEGIISIGPGFLLAVSRSWGLVFDSIESEKHKRMHSGHFTRLIGDPSFRDYLDLFQFCFFKAKKSCHIGDLIRTYEVRGLRAESLYTRSKLAALHCFRDVQANAA
jgi:hypothetical protein